MPRLVTILEDNVRFRDGKKWKQRYCKLNKPESKSGSITMYITKQFGTNAPNQIINEKLSGHYLIDEITGFEYGRHVDKEGSVMALIGRNVVYCIAFSQNDTMFRWAENLKKYFTCANFHVTLKKVSETSGLFNKITSGIQGNLHVQSMRLCLIGEPADGNKFICEWTTANINSIDINDTDCDKVKELIIKSNSKLQKSKGHFEFEISVPQNNLFTECFDTFLKSCQDSNEDFRTNFITKRDSIDTNTDTTSFSYSIFYPEMNCSNSDNSSSLEKRSSEIPIPRSREHSGPDQRPIDNVQIKIRKSNKNFAKVLKENKKHSSLIETNGMFDHNACLFDDDEEIADQFDNKARNLLCNGLSQESSGVYVNGASSSLREPNLSARILNQDDSGCGNLSSTSSTQNYVINLPNVLPPRQKKVSPKENVILSFYQSIIRSPLLLSNYKKYYQLLRFISNSSNQIIKRSNSFNCVHLFDKSQFGNSRKYSNSNFPLNLNYQISDQNFNYWKKKIVNKISENERSYSTKNESDYFKPSSSHSLLNRLPFKSSKDFHNSIIKSMQNGTACLYLFCYHHFLMLLNDLKVIIKNLECKQKSFDAIIEDNKFKNINNSKENIYNRWLEKIQSEYSKSFDVDNRSKRVSILDINLILIYEIANALFHSKKCYSTKHGSCDCILRHSCYMNNNPTIELNNDKSLLKRVEEQIFKPSFKESPMYLNTGLVISSSSSTPDFRCYNQSHKTSKQQKKNKEIKYQNMSSLDTFDTMNHTFPKQSISLNKPESSESKGGSFKKFRRKYSPGFLMPFFHLGSSKFSNTMFTRRKTPSTHSTLSEPICHSENKDQNNYYNIGYRKQSYTKRSLSVVFDSSFPYEERKECHNYINVQNNKGLMYKTDNDSNSYICSGPSSIFDDDSYPEEILDPSRNYGDLHFVKSNCSKMKSLRQDSENQNSLNIRRASMSFLSNKSFQNFPTSRPTSFRAQQGGYSNISQNNSDDISSNINSGNVYIPDFVNGNVIRSSSPQSSTQSCSPGSILSSQKAVPRSLNYVTVMENNYSRPLSIYPPIDYSGHEYSSDFDSNRRLKSHNFKRIGITPQPSPIVDYCQIDLNCTYALKAIDRVVLDKPKSRDKDNISKNGGSPEDVESNSIYFDQADNYSISSSSFSRDRKNKHLPSNKKCFRRLFSRKPESTN